MRVAEFCSAPAPVRKQCVTFIERSDTRLLAKRFVQQQAPTYGLGPRPFISKSACAHEWPGVPDCYDANPVVPIRQTPPSHRHHLCARLRDTGLKSG